MHIPPFSSSNPSLIHELAVGVGAEQVHSDLWHHLLNVRKVDREYTQESMKKHMLDEELQSQQIEAFC